MAATTTATTLAATAATATTTAAKRLGKTLTAHAQREGGGFVVHRPVGGAVDYVGSVLMLDHFGPVLQGPGEAVGAPDHPHRGFETVTYMLNGEWEHRDSVGNSGTLGPGWVQWMTAGSGVVHSETPSEALLRDGGLNEGFQLWTNLKAADKMVPPRYQDTPPEAMPVVEEQDGKVWVRVIAGSVGDVTSPIETRYPMLFFDVRVRAGGRFAYTIPAGLHGFVYTYRGTGEVQGRSVTMRQITVLEPSDEHEELVLTKAEAEDTEQSDNEAAQGTDPSLLEEGTGPEFRCLLVASEAINEPIARYGPFVMNTREEIMQAMEDYHQAAWAERSRAPRSATAPLWLPASSSKSRGAGSVRVAGCDALAMPTSGPTPPTIGAQMNPTV